MMRTLTCSCLALLTCSLAAAQAKYDLLVGGKKAGTASLTQNLSKDGVKTVKLIVNLRMEGQAVRITNESVYAPTGRPVRKFMETTLFGPVAQRRQIVVSFTADKAFVVDERGGDRKTAERAIPDGGKIEDAAEFWFLRDKPKPGDVAGAHRFDLESTEWRFGTTTYVGPTKVKVGKKTVDAHELMTQRGTVYVDDKGYPLLIEMGEMQLQRQF